MACKPEEQGAANARRRRTFVLGCTYDIHCLPRTRVDIVRVDAGKSSLAASGWSVPDLHEALPGVVGELNRASARLVGLCAAALADGAWFEDGIKSPVHWLVLRAGLDRSRAATVVRLARRYGELPTTVAAFAAGQLSLEQAAAVARHTPADHERAVSELAVHATVPQIIRATARYPFAQEPAAPDSAPDSAPDVASDSGSDAAFDTRPDSARAGPRRTGCSPPSRASRHCWAARCPGGCTSARSRPWSRWSRCPRSVRRRCC